MNLLVGGMVMKMVNVVINVLMNQQKKGINIMVVCIMKSIQISENI